MQVREDVTFSLDIAVRYKKFHSVLCARFQVMEMDRSANPREMTVVKTPGGPPDAVVEMVRVVALHPKPELARGVILGAGKELLPLFVDRNLGRILCRVGRKLVCVRVVCRPSVRTHVYGQIVGVLLEQSTRALLCICCHRQGQHKGHQRGGQKCQSLMGGGGGIRYVMSCLRVLDLPGGHNNHPATTRQID